MFKNSKNGMGLVIGVALAAGLTGSVTAGGIDEPKDVLGPKLSRDWRSDTSIMTLGADGKVIYLYGESQPEVVCAPLRLCEIELQAGELVEDTFVGDNVRWKVDPAVSGSPQGNKIHLVVKPTAPNLATSLVVTTTRRVYHINLKSHPSEYMARVAFIYPEDVQAKFERENDRIEASTIQSSGEPAENLNFQYRIRGFSSWRPQRVYNDGQKTYIEFPQAASTGDIPVLFVMSGDKRTIVNYRLKGVVMIVDAIFERAILVSGVGKNEEKIVITKKG